MKHEKQEKTKKKSGNFKIFVTSLALIIVIAVVFLSAQAIMSGRGFTGTSTNPGTPTSIAPTASGEVQHATLKMVNYQYVVDPQPLKAGVPVEMTVDLNTVTGCMRDVVISSFGVRKYVKPGDNVITFTPTHAGTFKIVCSMNMGRGTFTVADSTGAVPAATATTSADTFSNAPTGGSCGAGDGGCGCGGR